MKIFEFPVPRKFPVGTAATELSECAHIHLSDDELVTFITPEGAQYDVTKKSWGFYATPSTNQRLTRHGLRAFLAQSAITGNQFVLLIELGKEELAYDYFLEEEIELIEDLSIPRDISGESQ